MATKRSLKGKRILVTCGPTWVALDEVRVLSNNSTGELGHEIVKNLNQKGASVTLLEGPVTHVAKSTARRTVTFRFFDELAKLFKKELAKRYHCVIHAAAVSDYRPLHQSKGKISSSLHTLSLRLIPTKKLIADVKVISPKTFLVGFKLEHHLDKAYLEKKVSKLFGRFHCDLVVANAQSGRNYRAFVFNNKRRVLAAAKTRRQVARQIVKILGDVL